MPTISRIFSSPTEPITRGFYSGFNSIGKITRTPDSRTRNELIKSIDAYSSSNDIIKNLAKDIKILDNKPIGTITDLLELASSHSLLTREVANIEKKYKQNVNNTLIKSIITASQENPAAIKFIDSIINNTDSLTSKAVLAGMPKEFILNKNLAKQLDATSEVMPEIAEKALNGVFFNPYELKGQKDFIQYLNIFTNPNNKPDKIKSIFSEIYPVCEKAEESIPVDLIKYLSSSAPMTQIRENLKIAEEVIKNLGKKAKEFNIIEFITKNINIK